MPRGKNYLLLEKGNQENDSRFTSTEYRKINVIIQTHDHRNWANNPLRKEFLISRILKEIITVILMVVFNKLLKSN